RRRDRKARVGECHVGRAVRRWLGQWTSRSTSGNTCGRTSSGARRASLPPGCSAGRRSSRTCRSTLRPTDPRRPWHPRFGARPDADPAHPRALARGRKTAPRALRGRARLRRGTPSRAWSCALRIAELTTPAVLVDAAALDHNLAAMSAALPGARLRPHVKAHKCTALARRQAANGHRGFTGARIREVEGMAAAGLGEDLLLANEVLDARRLGRLDARVTVAIDSDATLEAVVAGGVREVLVDVNVGLPRCGCAPEMAGRLADRPRARGPAVRGRVGAGGRRVLQRDAAGRARGAAP